MTPKIMPTPVRLPAELKKWLQASAAANRRSVSAEIITLIVMARAQIEGQAMPGENQARVP